MPTGRGWAAIGVAAALLVLWIGFGEIELMTTAVFLLAAVAAGMAFVAAAGGPVSVNRRLHPSQAHEGDTVVVEMDVAAPRQRWNAVVEDAVHGLGVARFATARVRPDRPAVARYEVHCRSRGIFPVGPVSVVVGDPFGLCERRHVAGGRDRLTVYPRVERLSGLPPVQGLDPSVRAARSSFAPHGGEEFFTLREYQVGDDLRRVHWPSSAKRDSLIIRQLEIPWQARALVVLDVRAESYPVPGAFEQAVRGAAAVVAHLHRNAFAPELWTAERVAGGRHGDPYHQAMEALATVQPTFDLDLRRAIGRLRRRGMGGGVLVLVTGLPDDGTRSAFRMLAADFSRTVVLSVSDRDGDVTAPFRRAGATTVVSRPEGSWAPGWRAAMEASWSTASAG